MVGVAGVRKNMRGVLGAGRGVIDAAGKGKGMDGWDEGGGV